MRLEHVRTPPFFTATPRTSAASRRIPPRSSYGYTFVGLRGSRSKPRRFVTKKGFRTCSSQDEALKRTSGFLAEVKERHAEITDIKQKWNGDVLSFAITVAGCVISGTVTVGSAAIEINGDVPFPASLFKGKIEEVIREQARLKLS